MARRTDEEFQVLELMRDPRVGRVPFMAKDVGSDSLKLVVGMLGLVTAAEGLPPVVDGRDEQ